VTAVLAVVAGLAPKAGSLQRVLWIVLDALTCISYQSTADITLPAAPWTGNGFPIGGLVTNSRLAAAFTAGGMEYFNTYGELQQWQPAASDGSNRHCCSSDCSCKVLVVLFCWARLFRVLKVHRIVVRCSDSDIASKMPATSSRC
jgi:hypothetical protein